MVETAFTLGFLMVLAVGGAQVARLLHYADSLDTVSRQGAFQAALSGHGTSDGDRAARELWTSLEPNGVPLTLDVQRSGRLVIVTAHASPFAGFEMTAGADHTVETFAPGSQP
jgi:hypothetical protein